MSMIGTYRLFNAMENATVTSGTLQTYLTTSTQRVSEYQAGVIQYGIFERAIGSTNIMTAIVGSNNAINYVTTAAEAVPSLQLFVGSTTAMTAASTVTYARNAILNSGVLNYIMSTTSVVRNANLSGFAQYVAPYYVWTARTSGTTSAVAALTYGNGVYVYGAAGGILATSFDAVTWTARTSNFGGTSTIQAATYGNNLYLIGGTGGTLATATDAVSWTLRTSGTSSVINALTYGALYAYSGVGGALATSTDGTTWTARTANTVSDLNAITFGNGKYVVAGNGGVMRVSTDGISWQATSPNMAIAVTATIGAGGSQWVAGGSGAIAYSTASNLFSTVTSGTTTTIYSIIYAAGQTQQYVYTTTGSSNNAGTSTDGITWTMRTVSTTLQTYYLSYGAGETAPYFSVNQNGGVYSSTDAITWVTRTASGATYYTTTYGGSRFYAAGNNGASLVSADGVTLDTLAPRVAQYGLVSNGTLLVSGGQTGIIKTSTDGVLWTTRTTGTTSEVGAGVYAAAATNKYVFAIQNGGALTSTDGITWAVRTIGFGSYSLTPGNIGEGIAYGDGRFIIAGYVTANSNGVAFTSTDGVSWSGGSSLTTGLPMWCAAASGLGTTAQQYVVGGSSGNIFTSTNGTTWTSRTTNTTNTFYGLAYGAGKYVAATTNNTYRTSTDGITWASPWLLSNADTIYAGVGGADGCVVVGDLASSRIYFAADGIQWATRTSSTTSQAGSLAYAPGQTQRFVMGANGGALSTSTDGLTWTARTTGTTSYIAGVAYNSAITEKYALVTLLGGLRTSTDAITWTARTSGTTSNINAIAASATLTNKYVYGGAGGVLATSTDGITWTARTSGTTSAISAVTFANNLYVYAGIGGVLRTSTDGVTWDARTSGTTLDIRSITYGSGLYCYVGNTAAIGTSTDGVTWNLRSSTTTVALNTVFYSGTRFVAAGSGGVTVYSTDGIIWAGYDPNTPSIASFYNITFVNNLFINGTATSTDGLSWSTNASYQAENQPTYANSAYWMIPASGATGMQTSTDALSWRYTPGGYNTATTITTIAYTSGPAPVVYGGASGIRTSTDGYSWYGGGFGLTIAGSINSIIYAGNRYVCCFSTNSMAYSENGVSWTSTDIGSGVGSNLRSIATSVGQPAYAGAYPYIVSSDGGTLYGMRKGIGGSSASITNPIAAASAVVSFGDSQYVVACGGYSTYAVSNTGLQSTWATRTTPSSLTSGGSPDLIAYASGQTTRWVFACGVRTICTSTDLVTWSTVTFGWTNANNVVVVKYLATAPSIKYFAGGAAGEMSTSTDGITWTQRTTGTSTAIFGVAYGNGRYVATLAGATTVLTSTDAITWTTATTVNAASYVLFDGTKFVTAGSSTTAPLNTSTDGLTWTGPNGLGVTTALGFAYGAGTYVMVGSSGDIRTSTDGLSWTSRTSGTSSALNAIVYNSTDAKFYAYGTAVQVSSTDGITWSAIAVNGMSGTTSSIRALTYANNTYVYAGDGGAVGTSTDGIIWTARTSGTTSILRSLAYANGVFFTAGDGGALRFSTDGITWNAQSSGTSSAINALTYGLGANVFGGAGGVLGTNI